MSRMVESGECGEVRPETLGYQRCYRPVDHRGKHRSQDGTEWDARSLALADARTWAGYRSAAFARQTGTLVVVVDAIEQGLDDWGYATICSGHDRLVIHETLRQAKLHASDPMGWCGICNGSEESDTY